MQRSSSVPAHLPQVRSSLCEKGDQRSTGPLSGSRVEGRPAPPCSEETGRDATGEQLENAVIRSGKDMKENMKKDELVQFDSRNVYVVYEAGGAPWIVIRSYAPWQ